MAKLDRIQYLRGFAALYVLVYHVGGIYNQPYLKEGFRAVSLFFAISGFIIAYTFKRANVGAAAQTVQFAARRFLRIYPPYWVAFLPVAIMFWFSDKGASWHHDPLSAVLNFFLIQIPKESILFVAWSLVFEMLFYCLFAVAVILVRLPITAFALAWGGAILAYGGISGDWEQDGFILTDYRNLYFLAGCLIAEARKRSTASISGWLFPISVAAFIIVPYLTHNRVLIFSGVIFVIITAVFCHSGSSNRALLLLGDASFSIYLTHGTSLVLISRVLKSGSIATCLVAALSALAIGLGFYFIVEVPLLRRLKRERTVSSRTQVATETMAA
jgi:exopolysaccharide production protein ExoZ